MKPAHANSADSNAPPQQADWEKNLTVVPGKSHRSFQNQVRREQMSPATLWIRPAFMQELKWTFKSPQYRAINWNSVSVGCLVMCELLWYCLLLLEKQRQNLNRATLQSLTYRGARRRDVCTDISSIFSEFLLSGHSADCPVRGRSQPSCCLLCLYPKLKALQAWWALWAVPELPPILKGHLWAAPLWRSHPAESGQRGPDLRWKLYGFS